MKNIQPVQMIGTQRSGTNLFRVMLNQLDAIAAPHPPHILQRFMPLLNNYGSLADMANFKELVNDVCLLVNYNPVEWDGLKLKPDDVIRNCQSNSLEAIFYAIYNLYAKAHNAQLWICKSMANVNFVGLLENTTTKPLYIYLHRDGRDVACSFKKALVGEKHIYHLAKKWKEDQLKCIELTKQMPAERVLQVSYENLIQNTQYEMERVCRFLKVSYKTDIFNFHQSDESKSTASAGEMWSNLSKPVMNNNYNKYRQQLNSDEIQLFEHIAGSVLSELGYQLDYPQNNTLLNAVQIAAFDEENRQMKQIAQSSMDPDGQKKRHQQNELLKHLKAKDLRKIQCKAVS